MKDLFALAKALAREHDLADRELLALLQGRDTPGLPEALFALAREARQEIYGDGVYLRGLIEFTNLCKNDCFYCGIRRSNNKAQRYRLTREEILACCREGWDLGFRTFVLQGGEDPYFTDDRLCGIVSAIRQAFPACAITLSVGERSRESFRRLKEAGADRYLLRHETADEAHYRCLHPPELRFSHRMNCLRDLRELGYQVGCGFMVGSPGQTEAHLVKELRFLKDFQPHMVGIGPFLAHQDTPFRGEPDGSAELTLYLLALIRLLLPRVLLPATTALGTAAADGRERGLLAGANVVMPNLSPVSVRKKYLLYDNKICTGEESAQCVGCLAQRIASVGCHTVVDRGDSKM